MDKTEKKSAEEILEFQLNYSSMLFTDEIRSLYKRHAERAIHEYAAQELDEYKAKLKDKIQVEISKYAEDWKINVLELIDKV